MKNKDKLIDEFAKGYKDSTSKAVAIFALLFVIDRDARIREISESKFTNMMIKNAETKDQVFLYTAKRLEQLQD